MREFYVIDRRDNVLKITKILTANHFTKYMRDFTLHRDKYNTLINIIYQESRAHKGRYKVDRLCEHTYNMQYRS